MINTQEYKELNRAIFNIMNIGDTKDKKELLKCLNHNIKLVKIELKSRIKYPKIKSLTLTKVYPKSEVNKNDS